MADRAPLRDDELSVRWLGCAGFEIRSGDDTLLIDPFLSRPSFAEVALGRMAPDEQTLERALPAATLILIGHSHYDHLMDAPAIARWTSATIVGTRSTCWLAEAMGLPAHRCSTPALGREHVRAGPFDVVALPSKHALAPVIGVPVPGRLSRPPRWRGSPHALQMSMGGALAYVVRVNGFTVVHLSSASLPDDPSILARAVPEGADLVLASIAIREGTPGYARTLITELHPRVIIPHHHDPLFGALDDPLPEAAQKDAQTFVKEAEGSTVRLPSPMREMRFRRGELKAISPGRVAHRAVDPG
jgi:L-ascorbate metabolism protein UlaG (beta-lactamase superfamily)